MSYLRDGPQFGLYCLSIMIYRLSINGETTHGIRQLPSDTVPLAVHRAEVLCVIAAIGIALTYAIDPRLPPGTQFGPLNVDFAGQPGTIALTPANNDSNFTRHGPWRKHRRVGRTGRWPDRGREALRPTGDPHQHDFLRRAVRPSRRLFRNVSRGESFTRQSVFFVQLVGVSLIVYSLVSAYAEGMVRNRNALLSFPARRAHRIWHLRAPSRAGRGWASDFRFGGSAFFFGLLVLAISEVFRQGLTLKREHDLTV